MPWSLHTAPGELSNYRRYRNYLEQVYSGILTLNEITGHFERGSGIIVEIHRTKNFLN